MAGSDKSNSGAEIKKKTSALDEDFGKDFLSFWGSPKKGKDKIDFDMGEAPKNKNKSFNFDKLDDFELGGDFGKLPNFKMNMTDLDFSSPDMSNVKPTAKPAEKQESKKGDFSFNFDFNELDKFDFDSGPAESNSKPNTFKQAMNHDSKSNSCTGTDSFKNMEKSKSLDKISATSKHENMLESKLSTSECPERNVTSHELLSEMKEISISDRNKDKTCSNEEGHRKQARETCFASVNTPKTTQDFILQSQLDDCSAEEDNRQFADKAESAMEKNCSMRRTDSSHSKHSIPENLCNSECVPETRMNEYSTGNGGLQNKFEGNQNVVACEMEVPRESYEGQSRIQSSSLADISIASGMANTEGKHGSGSNLNLPSWKSYSSPVKPMSLNDKLASALQKRSLKKTAENELHHTSSATDRETKKNHEHAESIKVVITEPYEAGPIKDVSNNSRGEKENGQTYSSIQLKTSSIQQQNATTSLGSSKDASEVDDSSLTDKRKIVSRFNISSVPNTTQKLEKLVTFKERSLEFPLKALSKTASSSLVKSGSVSAFLKRKTFEVSPSIPEKLKSLKHDMESANERKSLDTFQKFEKILPIAVSEMSNTAHYNNSVKEILDVEVHQKDGEVDKTKNKQNTSEEVNMEDIENGNPYKEQIEESCFIKPCAENINQDTALKFPNETESSISQKPASVKEQDDSKKTVGSSQSRNTSPGNSYHSRLNDGENEILSKLNLRESNQNHLKIHIDSSKDVSENNQDLHGEFNHLPQHRNSNSLKVTMRDKVMAIIHCKASDKPAQNAHLKSLPVNAKEASPDIKEFKALNLSPSSDSRSSKQNHEHIRAQNINMLKSNDIFSNKGLSVEKSDTSRFKLKASNLLDPPNRSNTMTSVSPSLAKLNSQILNSGTAKEAKIAEVAESNSKSPLSKAWINSSDSCGVPMKRKTFEGSTILNPLKRGMESPAGRKNIDISSKSQSGVVPVTENFGESDVEECVNDLKSTHVPELRGITTGVERFAPFEEVETVEKADFYRKKLEDMGGRLTKQHDEARELLVRAAVNNNNNKLLKLKYQDLDEKIRSLQKFTASLQAKAF